MFSATISGNLCSDPKLHATEGNTVCKLRVAVRGKKTDPTIYITVELWGRRGEWASDSLGRGAKVICSGEVYLNEWVPTKGEDEGKTIQEFRMNANQLEAPGEWKPNKNNAVSEKEGPPDDIPF